MRNRWTTLLAAGLLALVPHPVVRAAAEAVPDERVETFGRGDVTVGLRAVPARVSPASDVEITLEISHPERMEVRVPDDLSDRFEGFHLEGRYEGETLVAAGQRHRTIHLRARPLPAAGEYRIAPFAIRVLDPAAARADTWFATRAVVFETASLLPPGEAPPEGVDVRLDPFWVRPSTRSLLKWTGCAGLAAAVLAGLVLLVRSLRRRIKLARMAPRERALLELRDLLSRDLPGKGRIKEFYVELTHVVRRYIERRYGIRAPEQTTEEFLGEAMRHPAFGGGTHPLLREFLQAADLVKFAGVDATPQTIERSVASARAYLDGEPSALAESAGGATP